MHWRGVLVISGVLGLALLPGGAVGQQQKPLKDQLVGTWTLLIDDAVLKDGTHRPNFGPNPEGTLIFTPDGHYSLQIMRVNRPLFVSKNRTTGTAEENKAAVVGTASHFGSYTADAADKSVTFRVEASLFPNQEGTRQKRVITALTDEVLTYNNPVAGNPAVDHGEVMWKKVK